MDFTTILLMLLGYVWYIVIIVFGILALLMPIFVYRMRIQLNKMEASIQEIKNDLGILLTIGTHVSKEISEKNKNL